MCPEGVENDEEEEKSAVLAVLEYVSSVLFVLQRGTEMQSGAVKEKS